MLRIHAVCEEDWESAGFGDFTLQQSLEARGKKHVINLIGNVDPLYWWDYVLKSVVIGPQRDPAWSAVGPGLLWLIMASSCGFWSFLFFLGLSTNCATLWWILTILCSLTEFNVNLAVVIKALLFLGGTSPFIWNRGMVSL